ASMTDEGRLRRGDVWLVDFGADPPDPEQAFPRPAVIVSDDRLHHPNLRMVIVVPGTSTIRRIPLHVSLPPDRHNGLTTETAFQVEQVRAVSTGRLVERLGRLDTLGRHAIDEILRNALNL
ncbi:MAG: type II toxin-antitoxin system PemK/MazF family toxin, partial [Acidimicrobiaceae bacterium]|nr:type II toxin-antitoxin system PemK/MazF family toxin [Acidimicrobiaceae bacterium]